MEGLFVEIVFLGLVCLSKNDQSTKLNEDLKGFGCSNLFFPRHCYFDIISFMRLPVPFLKISISFVDIVIKLSMIRYCKVLTSAEFALTEHILPKPAGMKA